MKEREQLILNHLEEAERFAKRLSYRYNIESEEAVADGYLGLALAAKTWKENGGSTFKTWWHLKVMQTVLDNHFERDGYLKLDGEKGNRCRVKRYRVYGDVKSPYSLEELEKTRDHRLKSRTSPDSSLAFVLEMMRHLNKREQGILLFYLAGYTCKEISQMEGVSQSRISQIIAKCGKKLHRFFPEKTIKESAYTGKIRYQRRILDRRKGERQNP